MYNTRYEISPNHQKLADIGRQMMDYSEEYGKIHGLKGVTDNGLRTLNQMSEVGYQLTKFGAIFGSTERSFSENDKQLISDFMNNKVDIERK